jgi:hypothetical protein
MHQSLAVLSESADFTVEELDSLSAPGFWDVAHDVTQVSALGGVAFVVGLSIT